MNKEYLLDQSAFTSLPTSFRVIGIGEATKEIIEKFKKENITNGFILNISNKKKESIEVCFKEAIGIGNYQKIIEKKMPHNCNGCLQRNEPCLFDRECLTGLDAGIIIKNILSFF